MSGNVRGLFDTGADSDDEGKRQELYTGGIDQRGGGGSGMAVYGPPGEGGGGSDRDVFDRLVEAAQKGGPGCAGEGMEGMPGMPPPSSGAGSGMDSGSGSGSSAGAGADSLSGSGSGVGGRRLASATGGRGAAVPADSATFDGPAAGDSFCRLCSGG